MTQPPYGPPPPNSPYQTPQLNAVPPTGGPVPAKPRRRRVPWWRGRVVIGVLAGIVGITIGAASGGSGSAVATAPAAVATGVTTVTATSVATATVTAPGRAADPVTVTASAPPQAAVTQTVAGPTVTATATATRTVTNTVTKTVRAKAPQSDSGSTGGSVLSFSGSGIKNSKPFTVTADTWTLTYSYDCSSFGMSGNFMVDVVPTGAEFGDSAVNELGEGGKSSTTQYGAGTYHLSVNSECSWSVRVVE